MNEISMYTSLFNTIPSKKQDIISFINKHKDGWKKYRNIIMEIRKIYPDVSKENKNEYDRLKKELPGATISGTFSRRDDSHLIQHSGCICIDIDKKPDINDCLSDIEKLRGLLKQEKWILAIMLSVGGRGLSAIVKIPADERQHFKMFKSLESYFKETYNVIIDKSCKDIPRFRYISYDPLVFLNEAADTYEIEDSSFNFGDNEQVKSNGQYFIDGSKETDLFTLANGLIKAGVREDFTRSTMRMVSKAMIWDATEDHKEKVIDTKIKNAIKRHNDVELMNQVREYVMSTVGTFLSTDVHRNLCLSTRVHQKNCSEYLSRLIKEEIIERVGTKNGQFRRVESELECMNWQDEDESGSFDLKLPLELHKVIDFNPGNIIMVAGVKETGKTAFALTTALLNSDKDVRYFNSEMGNAELKKRLMGFPDTTEESWKHVTFYNRAYNHADVIFPDAINIIDFLEIPSSAGFFSAMDIIRSIHDKVVTGKGIVIIFMQKKRDQEYAVGGHFTAQKARVYFNLEFQEIEIKHCKTPKFGLSLHGRKIRFTLQHGNTFVKAQD